MPAISQLAAYYLDCISRDRDDKVSTYLTNAYGNVDYGQVFSRPEADVEDSAAYSADARALFAKADALHLRRVYTKTQQVIIRSACAASAKSNVVFFSAAFVGVAFNADADSWVGFK